MSGTDNGQGRQPLLTLTELVPEEREHDFIEWVPAGADAAVRYYLVDLDDFDMLQNARYTLLTRRYRDLARRLFIDRTGDLTDDDLPDYAALQDTMGKLIDLIVPDLPQTARARLTDYQRMGIINSFFISARRGPTAAATETTETETPTGGNLSLVSAASTPA